MDPFRKCGEKIVKIFRFEKMRRYKARTKMKPSD